MDASALPPAAGSSFEAFLSGKEPRGGEAPTDAAAVVPPPLGAVDGDPVINHVAVNIRRELAQQLRSGDATVLDASFRVRIGGNLNEVIYQPDVIVDAGEPDRGTHLARQPKVIFEVAAAGSERGLFIEGWHIHEKLPTTDVHVMLDPERMSVILHRRQKDGGWQVETLIDAEDSVFLPTIHCVLTLETIYQEAASGGDEGRI